MIIDIESPISFTVFHEEGGVNESPMYSSILHFFECEKYRGYDEEFRRHLLGITDPEMLVVESRFAGGKTPNPNWDLIQERVIKLAVWSLFVAHSVRITEAFNNKTLQLCDELEMHFVDIITRTETGCINCVGVLVSPEYNKVDSIEKDLLALIPTEITDVVSFSMNSSTNAILSGFCQRHHIPTIRIDIENWIDGAQRLDGQCSGLILFSSEYEMKQAKHIANIFISEGTDVCIRD